MVSEAACRLHFSGALWTDEAIGGHLDNEKCKTVNEIVE